MFSIDKDRILTFTAKGGKTYTSMVYYYDELCMSLGEAHNFLLQFGVIEQMGFVTLVTIYKEKIDCVDYLNSLVVAKCLLK